MGILNEPYSYISHIKKYTFKQFHMDGLIILHLTLVKKEGNWMMNSIIMIQMSKIYKENRIWQIELHKENTHEQRDKGHYIALS